MELYPENKIPAGNALNFINQVLIADTKKLIDAGFHYFAFSTICQGIEYIGAFFDTKTFEEPKQSEKRFTNAIKFLFVKRNKDFYRQHQTFLFKQLRGCLIHQFRPSHEILLSSTKNGWAKEKHLQTLENKYRLFLIEEFYLDFIEACENLNKRINFSDHTIDLSKATADHISVFKYQGGPETSGVVRVEGQIVTGGTESSSVVEVKPQKAKFNNQKKITQPKVNSKPKGRRH